MTLREALSKSFSSGTWNSIENKLLPPELLKMACLIEFEANSTGSRINFLRKSLAKLTKTGYVSLSDTDNP